jgi:hypothetical protein
MDEIYAWHESPVYSYILNRYYYHDYQANNNSNV